LKKKRVGLYSQKTEERERRRTKSLMCALGLISCNLPLPPDLLNAISSICNDTVAGGGDKVRDREDGAGGKSKEIPVVVKKVR